MFSGYKDAQPFYNNQPLFENRSQASFLPGDTSKQTSAPPWDYTQQSFSTVPCYTGDQNLNPRHTGPIHNQVVSQFDNSSVLTHYKNIGTGNNHQSVVRPRAVINCQSNCNACYNHSVGRIPSHWNTPTDSVHYVHGNSSGSLATEEVSRYAPNLSNFSQHEETSNHFQTGFTAPLNKLSRFSKDSTTSASKTDVLSPTEDCNVLRNPPPSDSATVKKDVSATCHGVCNRGKCKFYQHQTIKFPSLEPIPIQQYGVPRENVVRYTGHNSGTSSCNQWSSHQPPGFWLQNGRPGFWMPPMDNVRNMPNSGMTNFWGDNGCEMPNQQLPPPPPSAPTSYHDITTNKGIVPIRNQPVKDVLEENKIHHQYQEGPPRYTELMQRKFPEEVQCRPHDALADCGIIQDPQYKPQNNKDIPRPTNNSSMESRSHSNLNGVNEVLSNFPASRSFSSYHKPKVPSTSSNFSTVLGIAQPPSRFSSDPTYTQSKISRSNNYMRFFSENNIDGTYNHSNDIVGSNFASKIMGSQHMPVHVPGKDVQSHGMKCLPPRNTESIIRYGGETSSDQLQSCGQMSDNSAQYHGMNTMQVIENNPSCSMSGTTCSPPNRREPGYHPGMSSRGDMFYSRQSLESYDDEDYSNIHSKVGVISRSTKEACDLNLPSMYVPTDKPQLVPLLEDPSINRPIKKRRPRSKHERWSHDHNQQMSVPVLDVRQFLATWDEEADDLSPAGQKLPDVVLSNSSAENPLLVLDCRNLNTNGVATLSAVDRNTISEGNGSENVIHMYHQQISPSASNIINDSGPEKSNTDNEVPSGSLEDCPSLIPIESENNTCIKQFPTGKIIQECNVQEGKNNLSKCNGAPNDSERSFTQHIYSSSMNFISENSSSVVQNSRTPSEGNSSNSDIAALQHNLQVGSNLNLTEECVNSETCVEDGIVMLGLPSLMDSTEIATGIPTLKTLCKSILKKNSHVVPSKKTENKDMPLTYESLEQSNKKEICIENALNVKNSPENSLTDSCNISLAKDNDNGPLPLDTLSMNDDKLEKECRKERKTVPACKKLVSSDDARKVTGKLVPADIDTNKQVTVHEKDGIKDSVQKLIDDIDEISENTSEKIMESRKSIKSSNNDVLLSSNNCNSTDTNKINSDEHIPLYLNDIAEDLDMSVTSSIPSSACSIEDDEMLNMKLQISDSDEERIDFSVPVTPKSDRLDCKQCPMSPIAIMLKEPTDMSDTYAKDITENSDKSTDSSDIFANLEEINDYNKVGVLVNSAKGTSDNCSEESLSKTDIVNSPNTSEGHDSFLFNSETLDNSTLKNEGKGSQISNKMNDEMVEDSNTTTEEILSHKETGNSNSSSVTESSSESIQRATNVTLSDHNKDGNIASTGKFSSNENVIFKHEKITSEYHELVHKAGMKCENSFHAKKISDTGKSVNIIFDQQISNNKAVNLTENILIEENHVQVLTKPEYQKLKSVEITDNRKSSALSPEIVPNEVNSEDSLHVVDKKTLNCAMQENKFSKECRKRVEGVICSSNKTIQKEESEILFSVNMSKDHKTEIECERSSVETNYTEKEKLLAESLLSEHRVPHECKKVNGSVVPEACSKKTDIYNLKGQNIHTAVNQKNLMTNSSTENVVKYSVSASDTNNISEKYGDSILKSSDMDIANLDLNTLVNKKIQQETKLCAVERNNCKGISVEGEKEICNDRNDNEVLNVCDRNMTVNVETNNEYINCKTNPINKFANECILANPDENHKKPLKISEPVSTDSTRLTKRTLNMSTELKKIEIDLSIKSYSQSSKIIITDEADIQNTLKNKNEYISSNDKYVNELSKISSAALQNVIPASRLPENNLQNEITNSQTISSVDAIVDTSIGNCHQSVKLGYFREDSDVAPPDSNITGSTLYNDQSSRNGPPISDQLFFKYSNLGKKNSESTKIQEDESFNTPVSKGTFSNEQGQLGSHIADCNSHTHIVEQSSTSELAVLYHSKWKDNRDKKTSETIEMEKCELSDVHKLVPRGKLIEEEEKNEENKIQNKITCESKFNQHNPTYVHSVTAQNCNKEEKHEKTLNNPRTLSTCLEVSAREVEFEDRQPKSELILNRNELHNADSEISLDKTKNGYEIEENKLDRHLNKTVLCISSANNDKNSLETSSQISSEEKNEKLQGGRLLQSISQKLPSEVYVAKEIENLKADIHDSFSNSKKTSLQISDAEKEGELNEVVSKKCSGVFFAKGNAEENKPASVIEQNSQISTKDKREELQEELLQSVSKKLPLKVFMLKENDEGFEGNEIQSNVCDYVPVAKKTSTLICIEGKREMGKVERSKVEELFQLVSREKASEIDLMEECGNKEKQGKEPLQPNISDSLPDKTVPVLQEKNHSFTLTGSNNLMDMYEGEATEDEPNECYASESFNSISSEFALSVSLKHTVSTLVSSEGQEIENEDYDPLSSAEEVIGSDKSELYKSPGSNFQVSKKAFSEACRMEDDDLISGKKELCESSEVNVVASEKSPSGISRIEKDEDENKTEKYGSSGSVSGCNDDEKKTKVQGEISVSSLDETMLNKSSGDIVYRRTSEEDDESKENEGKINVEKVGDNVDQESESIKHEIANSMSCKIVLHELLEKVINSKKASIENTVDRKINAGDDLAHLNSFNILSGKTAVLVSEEKNLLISVENLKEADASDANDYCSTNIQLNEIQGTSSDLHVGSIDVSVNNESVNSSNLSGNDKQLHVLRDDLSVSGTSTCESTEACQGQSGIVSCESAKFKIHKSVVCPTDNSHKVHNLPVNMLQSDNLQKFESDLVCKKLENKYNNSDICKTASADLDVNSDLHAENKAANSQNLQDSDASMQESEERTLDKKIPEGKQIVLISDPVHSSGSICFEDEDTLEFPGNNMVVEKLNHLERTFESIQNTVHDLNYNLLSPERLSDESELNKSDSKTSGNANVCGKSKGDLSLNLSNSIEKHLPLKSSSNNLQDLSFDSSNCKNYRTTNFPNKTVNNETSSPQNWHSPKYRLDDGSNDGIQITEFNVSNGTSEFDKQIVTVYPSVDKDSLSKNDSIEPLTVECEKEIQSVSSPQLTESNCNSSKEPLSVDTDMPQLEVISTEISPNGSDSLEMPYLECIKNSESSASVLGVKLSQDETKNEDEDTLNFVSALSEDTSKQYVSVAKSTVQNDLHPVQLNTVKKNKSLEDNESMQEVSVSLEANISNEKNGNLQTVALLPIVIASTETKKSSDFKVRTHKHLEKVISLLPATVETLKSKTKEHYKGSMDEDIEEGSMSPLAVETEISSKDSQVSHKGYKNEDVQEDRSSPITENSTEANIYSPILKASSPQMLYDTALLPASREEKEKKRTEMNTKDTEENSHMHAYEDLTPPGNAADENKNEENETELPVSPNTLQVIKSYLGHESTTVQVQVVEVNEEDFPETWESLQIITSDLEYGSEACEKEVEKPNDSIESVPQTVTLGHEEGSVPLSESETVQNEVSQISSAGKSSATLYVGIDASSDLLPADSVSNWPYLEEEVFSDIPIANSDNVDIPCASSSAANSQESLSPRISSNNALPSDASMAVSGLKCRLSWKKIFALSKANHVNKKTDKFYKQANNIVSDKLGSPNSVLNNSDTFNGLNKNKHRKKEIELGPAKIEVRLTPTPPPKGIGLPKKWEVVDGPKLEKASKMSSDGSSTNGGNIVDVANPVPIVLVKRLILKRRSSDESDVELTAKKQIVSSPDNSSKSESIPSIRENSDIDGDISNSATQVSSERFTELSDSEDDDSSETSTSSSSSSDDGNSSCSCSTVARKISDPDSKKSKLDNPSSDLNTDVLNSKSKLSCECVDHCKCNNAIDEMSSSSEDRLLPRVIIKRTTGMGSNNYQSFLRSVSSSNECNDHWQPVVRLERSTSLDELAKRITTSNDTNKVGIQHRLKIILKSPQTQPQVHLVPLSLQKSRRHSEPEANQEKQRKSYFSRLNSHHTITGRWRKRKRYNRRSRFSKSASLSSEPNSSPTHNFTAFNKFTKVQNVRAGSKDDPFSMTDEKEGSTNVDAHKHPTDDEYRVVENKNRTKENVTKITFQRHKKKDILKRNDNKIIHIKFKNCNQDLVLTGEQKDQDNKESSMHNESNERISPNVNTRERNVRDLPSTNNRFSPKLNPSTNLTPIFDHCEEGKQQQHSKKISMSTTDKNENVKSPQHSAEKKNTVVDQLTIPVKNDIDSALSNKEANSVKEQLTDNFLSNTQPGDSQAKKKRNSDNACLDSDLPFFQSDRILSISSVKRRRSNMDKSSSQTESSASEERCENSSVCEINNEKPMCDSAAQDGYNQPADPVLSETPDDVTCQACGHVYADGQERPIHIRRHPYHCQRCHLAFKSETEFVGHLSAQHPRTRERHHCLLCERSFPTADRHKLHLTGRTHRHLELTQRRTIHTLFTIFTGRNCPVLSPLSDSELARLNWFPVEPGTIHFYHQATPLQRAVQDLVTRKRGDFESSSPVPSRSFTSAEDNLSSPSTPSSSSSSSSSS